MFVDADVTEFIEEKDLGIEDFFQFLLEAVLVLRRIGENRGQSIKKIW